MSQPIPHIRRTAIDIEIDSERGRSIETIVDKGDGTITAISFKGDDIDRVLVLGDSNETRQVDGFELVTYDSEVTMLRDAFRTMNEYPVILTYNGMNFDLPYMESRAKVLSSINKTEIDVPFSSRKSDRNGQTTRTVTFHKSIHVDLYNIMSNAAFRIYVFGGKYSKNGLDDVSKAILGTWQARTRCI